MSDLLRGFERLELLVHTKPGRLPVIRQQNRRTNSSLSVSRLSFNVCFDIHRNKILPPVRRSRQLEH